MSFFLATRRACSQATLSETAKVMERKRQRDHFAADVAASVGVT